MNSTQCESMPATVDIIREFGILCIRDLHQHFIDDTLDNNEHIPNVRRFTEVTINYLRSKNVSPNTCKIVKKELIAYANKLFLEEWMKPPHDADDPPVLSEGQKVFKTLIKNKYGDG
ncbi:MAG: hypothetical protein Q7J15_09140 [Candidatus Desulfaltia sp.]|nr:hypothetical protein [Candidatus Desulfaltia sp.]